jgi:tetratricopeptide (TPR) repeat protein
MKPTTGAWVALVAVAAAIATAQDHRKTASWYLRTYGPPADDARLLGQRAQRVFARVAAVADKAGNGEARLVLVGGPDTPLAEADPTDGDVVLTARALHLCYGGVPPEVGDARVAFVLGHELAHLGHDHFWHAFAARAAERATPRQSRQSLVPLVQETPAEARSKELQADAYGIVYMVAAGYPAGAVVGAESSFLDDWVRAVGDPNVASHPSARHRADLLRAELAAIAAETDFFSFGIRLFQLGRYADAITLLSRFERLFPGREVLNALGLAHYQLALRHVAGCEAEGVLRFRLPTRFDPETLARRVPIRGVPPPDCARTPVARGHLEDATRLFIRATETDVSYVPARVNLASTRLFSGDAAEALAAARSAVERSPGDPDALNVRAIAHYLLLQELGLDGLPTALEDLALVKGVHAGTLYNRGMMLWERDRRAAARQNWEEFLKAEPGGVFATAIRRRMGIPADEPSARPVRTASLTLPVPALPVGGVSDHVESRLARLRKSPFEVGSVSGAFYSGPGLHAIRIDHSLEVVIEDFAGPTEQELVAALGPPRESLPGPGATTLVYSQGRAFDIAGGRVVRRVLSAH